MIDDSTSPPLSTVDNLKDVNVEFGNLVNDSLVEHQNFPQFVTICFRDSASEARECFQRPNCADDLRDSCVCVGFGPG